MTKHATVYWSLCLVTATALVGGRQLVGAAPPQANAPLDERVAAIVKSDILVAGVPSVSVAVMRDGKMLLERAWGVADIEKNVSASKSTTYPAVGLAVAARAETSGERIRLLGFVPNIADRLGEFALVVVPSRSEGFGRVAVESLRAGISVLATRVEGLIEALQDLRNPWLPEQRNRWSDRILRELDEPAHDRSELLAAARRFDQARYTDEILDCYQQVLHPKDRAT